MVITFYRLSQNVSPQNVWSKSPVEDSDLTDQSK